MRVKLFKFHFICLCRAIPSLKTTQEEGQSSGKDDHDEPCRLPFPLYLDGVHNYNRLYSPLRPFSTRWNFVRGATFSVRLKKFNCFQLCCCTLLTENDAPCAKFRLVKNRLYGASVLYVLIFERKKNRNNW